MHRVTAIVLALALAVGGAVSHTEGPPAGSLSAILPADPDPI